MKNALALILIVLATTPTLAAINRLTDTVYVTDTIHPARISFACCDTSTSLVQLTVWAPHNSGFIGYSRDIPYYAGFSDVDESLASITSKHLNGKFIEMGTIGGSIPGDTPNAKIEVWGYSSHAWSFWYLPNQGIKPAAPIAFSSLPSDTVFFLSGSASIKNLTTSTVLFKPFASDSASLAGWSISIYSGRPWIARKDLSYGQIDTLFVGDSVKITKSSSTAYPYLVLLETAKTNKIIFYNQKTPVFNKTTSNFNAEYSISGRKINKNQAAFIKIYGGKLHFKP